MALLRIPRATLMPVLLLIFAVWAMSTSVILIKLSELSAEDLSFWRLLLAALLLAPLALRAASRHRGVFHAVTLRHCLIPGVLLGIHLITWVMGARMTPAANATLMVNVSPLVMPLLLFALARERVTPRECLATGIALCGLVILAVADYRGGEDHWIGDLICFGSMLLLAVYLALGRGNALRFPDPWLYTVPVYAVGAVACLLWLLAGGNLPAWPRGHEWWIVTGMTVLPTMLGHGLVLLVLRRLRGQLVAVVNMGQFFFAGTMAFLLFHEVPSKAFWGTSLFVLAGGALIVARGPRRDPSGDPPVQTGADDRKSLTAAEPAPTTPPDPPACTKSRT